MHMAEPRIIYSVFNIWWQCGNLRLVTFGMLLHIDAALYLLYNVMSTLFLLQTHVQYNGAVH